MVDWTDAVEVERLNRGIEVASTAPGARYKITIENWEFNIGHNAKVVLARSPQTIRVCLKETLMAEAPFLLVELSAALHPHDHQWAVLART